MLTVWLIIPQMAARIRNTVLASLVLALMTTACSNQAQKVFDEAQKFYDLDEYQKAIDHLSLIHI